LLHLNIAGTFEMIGTHDLGPAGAIVHTFAILDEHFIEE